MKREITPYFLYGQDRRPKLTRERKRNHSAEDPTQVMMEGSLIAQDLEVGVVKMCRRRQTGWGAAERSLKQKE